MVNMGGLRGFKEFRGIFLNISTGKLFENWPNIILSLQKPGRLIWPFQKRLKGSGKVFNKDSKLFVLECVSDKSTDNCLKNLPKRLEIMLKR